MTYISSQSLLSSVRQSVLQAQSGLARAQEEISTGVKADLGVSLGAGAGADLAMKNAIDRLTGFATSNATAATRLDTTAAALTTMSAAVQKLSASLIAAGTAGGSTTGLQAAAQTSLGALLSGLNTSIGGSFVFGGINSAAAPLATYAAGSGGKPAVDAAFQQAFGTSQSSQNASSIGGAAMAQFLDGPFASLFASSGWSADWSQASSTATTTAIGPGQTATTSVSANETAFRQIAEAYTMIGEFTGSTISADAKAAVVAKATTLLQSGLTGLTNLQSGVGAGQAAIDSATTANQAQVTILKGHVSDAEGVDRYALSNTVTSLQTQLQASYELTSRLQSLSLVNYLNG